ncbi:hypothetical protein C7S16_0961 [Burkholderia thailandensis]|uniref:Uncharacterized protein n=1 Tax=Burkholderia thailandensis TaxID=57975 RepID=A0AAW9D750_BURTH|nr:hypothetical protein [Burkholderia thailandensis]
MLPRRMAVARTRPIGQARGTGGAAYSSGSFRADPCRHVGEGAA